MYCKDTKTALGDDVLEEDRSDRPYPWEKIHFHLYEIHMDDDN